LGLLAGLAFSVAHAIVVIPFGMLADRVSRRRLIAGCMFVWSVMTMACGLANSFVHLLLARMGVGGGEAGAQSASLSLVSDLYDARHRGTAVAIFYASGPVGAILAGVLAGPVTAAYGWRTALIAAGVPGIVMTAALLLFGRDPPRPQAAEPVRGGATASLGRVLQAIGARKSLLHLLIAMTLATFVISGIGAFGVSFFLRYHGVPQSHMAAFQGAIGAGSTAVLLTAGFLSDRLARLDRRWGLWLIVIVLLVATPLLLTAYLLPSGLALGFYLAGALLGQFWIAPGYALAQSLVPAQMRATGAAVQFILLNLIGFGCGPVVAGLLSDRLAGIAGADGLRYALIGVALVNLWAALHFLLATRTVAADLDAAGQT
jgi:MFS family permease